MNTTWFRGLPTALALGAVGLVALPPLAGLLGALIWPPVDPLTGAATGLGWGQGGARLTRDTGLLALIVGLLATAQGSLLAVAETRLDFPGRRILCLAALLPLAVPSYIAAAALAGSLGSGGWIGRFVGGMRPEGMGLTALVLVVATAPVVQLVVGAALLRTGAVEEEAARTLGAGWARSLRWITLPSARPAMAYGGLLAALYALGDFGAVAVLDTPVLTWRLYQAVAAQDLARAAGLGALLLALALPLWAIARVAHGSVGPGAANPRPPTRRAPSLALGLGVALALLVQLLIGLVVPVLTLGGWVVDGLRRGLPFAPVGRPVLDTLVLALVSAAVLLLLALPPALRANLARDRMGRALEGAVLAVSALPGVLLAFGWVLAALGLARAVHSGLYATLLGSGLLLVLGYAARFLAEVYGPMAAAVARLDPRRIDAARLLGASRGRILNQVVRPAVQPGVAAGALLGLVAVLKELPVTLLLGSATGRQTLAFRVWDRYGEALWHDAGLAGLLLLAVALAAVGATLRWRRHG